MDTYSNTHNDSIFDNFNDSDLKVIHSILDYTKVMGSSLFPAENDYLTKINEQIYENLLNPQYEFEEYDDLTDPSAYLDIIYEDSFDNPEDDYSSEDENTISDYESEEDDWVTY